MMFPEMVQKTIDIISKWDGFDFWVKFMMTSQSPRPGDMSLQPAKMPGKIQSKRPKHSKPVAVVIESSVMPEEARQVFPAIQENVFSGLPVYYSFASAANAINLVLNHYERRIGRQ